MQFHSVAGIFPEMLPEEFASLKASIETNGQRVPIYTHEGLIVDGRHRYRACIELGIEPRCEEWDGVGSLCEFVRILNAERRHLDTGAKQMAAARFAIELEKEAKVRQLKNLKNAGSSVQICTDEDLGYSRTKAAEKFGIGERSVASAIKVTKHGDDSLKQSVEAGNIAVSVAAVVADLPAEEQREIVARGEAEILRAAKEIKLRKSEKNIATRQERIIEKTKQEIFGRAFITHSDCQLIVDIPPFDLLIADPPYFTDGDYTKIVESFLCRVKPTGQSYVFCSADPMELQAYFQLSSHALKLEQVLVWNYNNTGQRQPSSRYNSNFQVILYYRGLEAPHINKPGDGTHQYACQTVNAPDGRIGDRFHPWQKPLELIERLILNSSNEGQIVLDPFACTGTTLLAAAKYNRVGIGYEINREFVDIAIRRGCEYVV